MNKLIFIIFTLLASHISFAYYCDLPTIDDLYVAHATNVPPFVLLRPDGTFHKVTNKGKEAVAITETSTLPFRNTVHWSLAGLRQNQGIFYKGKFHALKPRKYLVLERRKNLLDTMVNDCPTDTQTMGAHRLTSESIIIVPEDERFRFFKGVQEYGNPRVYTYPPHENAEICMLRLFREKGLPIVTGLITGFDLEDFLNDKDFSQLNAKMGSATIMLTTIKANDDIISGLYEKVGDKIYFFTMDLRVDGLIFYTRQTKERAPRPALLSKRLRIEDLIGICFRPIYPRKNVPHDFSRLGHLENLIIELLGKKPDDATHESLIEAILREDEHIVLSLSMTNLKSWRAFKERILAWAFVIALEPKDDEFLKRKGERHESPMDIIWCYLDNTTWPMPKEVADMVDPCALVSDDPKLNRNRCGLVRRLADLLAHKTYGQ